MIDLTTRAWLAREDLDRLIALLREDGRRVIGPVVQDSAIVYDEVGSTADLPTGITDEQAPGHYRISAKGQGKGNGNGNGSPGRSFDFASSPTSWKSFTFPAKVPIAKARRNGGALTYEEIGHDMPRMAFLGVRACDIAALEIHDDVLAGGPYIDEDYADRRGKAFIVAVECAVPSGTCFCASMGTGPEVSSGFDIALTELDDGYVAKSGSAAGQQLLERMESRRAHLRAGTCGCRCRRRGPRAHVGAAGRGHRWVARPARGPARSEGLG